MKFLIIFIASLLTTSALADVQSMLDSWKRHNNQIQTLKKDFIDNYLKSLVSDYETCLSIAKKENDKKTCSLYEMDNQAHAKEVFELAANTFKRTLLEVDPEKNICFNVDGFHNCKATLKEKSHATR